MAFDLGGFSVGFFLSSSLSLSLCFFSQEDCVNGSQGLGRLASTGSCELKNVDVVSGPAERGLLPNVVGLTGITQTGT